jgi:hypothetical protein
MGVDTPDGGVGAKAQQTEKKYKVLVVCSTELSLRNTVG